MCTTSKQSSSISRNSCAYFYKVLIIKDRFLVDYIAVCTILMIKGLREQCVVSAIAHHHMVLGEADVVDSHGTDWIGGATEVGFPIDVVDFIGIR